MSDFYMISLRIPNILLPSYLPPNPIAILPNEAPPSALNPPVINHQSCAPNPLPSIDLLPYSLFPVRLSERTNCGRLPVPLVHSLSLPPPHTPPGRCASPSSQIWPRTDHFAYRIERLYTIQGVSGQESDSSAELISRVNWLLS
jgi:hypothetical protein